ncbi:MAG TPA: cellulase family glycosylhydrolase [Candidatus Limnocylindrales bacterium]
MKNGSRVFTFLAAAVLVASMVGPAYAGHQPPGPPNSAPHADGFVKRDGSDLKLNGRQFDFLGTNNYYLMYSSPLMVNDVLNAAAANGFTVMRTWGWLDQTPKNNIVFQTFSGGTATYNDGATGLTNLDYVVAQAGKDGLKLVIPFTGNWGDFGGMDTYVTAVGGTHHDDFYTNAQAKILFKAWISHLLNHVNSITGVAYKDDPTIMTWELANEPRCVGSSSALPRSANCTTATITGWAAEMSAYIKSIDKKHLTSSGSEGELCIAGSTDWTRNCGEGVDELAISKLPTIDVMSYHLYPDPNSWNKDMAWTTTWIQDHIKLAKKIGKPSMLGEFGTKNQVTRNVTYQSWTDTVRNSGGNGALFWILTGIQDDGTLYPDYDGYRITCPSPVCTTLANAVIGLKDQRKFDRLAPVADNLSAVVDFGQPATFAPAASAVAYGGHHNAPVASTIDLDTATAGQQKSITVTGGTFALQTSGAVVFTPASGYHGPASTTFTIQDKEHRTSNAATLSVIVKPQPGVPIQLFSFEDGVDGWAWLTWSGPATVSQSTDWASDGTHSLLGTPTDASPDHWMGVNLATTLDLSNGYSTINVDVHTATVWGFAKISIQAGPAYTWCESGGVSVQPGITNTVSFDLTTTTCDLTQIHAINVYFPSVPQYIDNIWAK